MAQYYIIYNGSQVGPMDKEMLLNYGLRPDSQVWHEGLPQWVPAYTIPELMALIADRPTPPMPPTPGTSGTSGKDRIVYAILALILGYFGIQYFYVGKTTAGLLTILLFFVTCGLWDIIVFVQAIVVLCGTQEEFERKIVYSNNTLPLF